MDTAKLVSEIEKRPILYDSRLSSTGKELKPLMWMEVGRETIPDWESLPSAEQQKRVLEIQKRWRTLRDDFKRELKYQKALECGARVATKSRRYKHYELLRFLEPVMERNSVHNWSGFDFYGEDVLAEDITVTFDEDTLASYEAATGHPMRCKSETPMYDEGYSEQLMNERFSYLTHFDADEMFFISMLPAFKQLTEEQKSLAKVKMLQVMHDIAYPAK